MSVDATAAQLSALAAAVTEFASLLADADPSLPVDACPGWDVAALGGHLGDVHRWARDAVVTGAPGGEYRPPAAAALADWYRTGAEALLDTLRATDPATPCWTFGPRPRVAGFWVRRQLHEVAVHLWDLRTAVGASGRVPEEVAADGIEEVLTMLLPRQVAKGRLDPLPTTVTLADAVGRRWLIDPAGTGAAPAATVEASVEDLFLLLWHRRRLSALQVTGDREAAAAVLAQPLVP